MITLADGWGPQRRRAAVTLGVEGPGGGVDEPMVVSPALPALLDVLGRRDLPATFFAAAEVAASEPLALTMIANAGNEIGALADESLRAIDAIESTGRSVRGVSAVAVDRELIARLARHPTVRYVSGGDGEIGIRDGVVSVPVEPGIDAARFLAAGERHEGGAARGPAAWHAATQVAIGRAVQRRAHLTLPLSLQSLERGDAFSVLVEILDLVHGLRRAERLWVPTLDEIVMWWLKRRPGRLTPAQPVLTCGRDLLHVLAIFARERQGSVIFRLRGTRQRTTDGHFRQSEVSGQIAQGPPGFDCSAIPSGSYCCWLWEPTGSTCRAGSP